MYNDNYIDELCYVSIILVELKLYGPQLMSIILTYLYELILYEFDDHPNGWNTTFIDHYGPPMQ